MIFFHQVSVGRPGINVTIVVIILGLFAPWGCRKRQEFNRASGLNDNGLNGPIQVDPAAMESFSSRAASGIAALQNAENRRRTGQAICDAGVAAGMNPASLLSSINGISFHGAVDFANILARGKSPATVSGGMEYVWWFDADGKSVSEHAFLVPQAGLSSSPAFVDGHLGVIFGCRGNIDNYSGYFATLGVYGLSFSLGIDLLPAFESYYRQKIPSNVPGINDNESVSFDAAFNIVERAAQVVHQFSWYRRESSVQSQGALPVYRSDRLKKLMERARLDINSSPIWKTSMDELYRRGIDFGNSLIDGGGRNQITVRVKELQNLTIQGAEDRSFYRQVRFPSSVAAFSNGMHDLRGDPNTRSSLQNPDGYSQKLMAISGALYSSHNSYRRAFFNGRVAGSDGPGIGSVSDERLQVVVNMLYGDNGSGNWGCQTQRRNHPDTRWFSVFVNGQKMYADCFGYGGGVEIPPSVDPVSLVNFESDWQAMVTDLAEIEEFFAQIEKIRYGTFHLSIQLHDSFQTGVSVGQISTGGIRVKNNGSVMSMCNAVSVSVSALAKYAPTMATAVGQGVKQLIGSGANPATAFAKLRELGRNPRLAVDMSHYYKTHWERTTQLEQLSPLFKAIVDLRNQSCQ